MSTMSFRVQPATLPPRRIFVRRRHRERSRAAALSGVAMTAVMVVLAALSV